MEANSAAVMDGDGRARLAGDAGRGWQGVKGGVVRVAEGRSLRLAEGLLEDNKGIEGGLAGGQFVWRRGESCRRTECRKVRLAGWRMVRQAEGIKVEV